MADYGLIMSLLLKGRSYREVVAAAGCSHRDVSAARTAMTVHEITAGRLGVMSEDDLAGLFPDGRSRVSAEYEQPDFARVARSMRANRHFTLLQAWRACAAGSSPLRRYGYAQYCHLFGEYAVRNDLVAVLHHEPGRAMLVGWAGDTIALAGAVTGEVSRAYLFLAVLPFAGLRVLPCVHRHADGSVDRRARCRVRVHRRGRADPGPRTMRRPRRTARPGATPPGSSPTVTD
jgi:hypothetical protein